jgi:hypothetical protein
VVTYTSTFTIFHLQTISLNGDGFNWFITSLNPPTISKTPATTSNDTSIATTAFVKNQNYLPYKYKELIPGENITSITNINRNTNTNTITAYFNTSGFYSIEPTLYSYMFPVNGVLSLNLNDTSSYATNFVLGIINNMISDYPYTKTVSITLSCVTSTFSTSLTKTLTIPGNSRVYLTPNGTIWNVTTIFLTMNALYPITNTYNGSFLKLRGGISANQYKIQLFEATELVNVTVNIYPFITIWNCLTDVNSANTITITLFCNTSLFAGNAGTSSKTIILLPNQQISMVSDGVNWIVNNNSIVANNILLNNTTLTGTVNAGEIKDFTTTLSGLQQILFIIKVEV